MKWWVLGTPFGHMPFSHKVIGEGSQGQQSTLGPEQKRGHVPDEL